LCFGLVFWFRGWVWFRLRVNWGIKGYRRVAKGIKGFDGDWKGKLLTKKVTKVLAINLKIKNELQALNRI